MSCFQQLILGILIIFQYSLNVNCSVFVSAPIENISEVITKPVLSYEWQIDEFRNRKDKFISPSNIGQNEQMNRINLIFIFIRKFGSIPTQTIFFIMM